MEKYINLLPLSTDPSDIIPLEPWSHQPSRYQIQALEFNHCINGKTIHLKKGKNLSISIPKNLQQKTQSRVQIKRAENIRSLHLLHRRKKKKFVNTSEVQPVKYLEFNPGKGKSELKAVVLKRKGKQEQEKGRKQMFLPKLKSLHQCKRISSKQRSIEKKRKKLEDKINFNYYID